MRCFVASGITTSSSRSREKSHTGHNHPRKSAYPAQDPTCLEAAGGTGTEVSTATCTAPAAATGVSLTVPAWLSTATSCGTLGERTALRQRAKAQKT